MGITVDDALEWAAGHRHGVLITLRRDGRAQSSDVAYAVVDDALIVSLTATRAKTANIRRDPRVLLHVTDPPTWSYVSFDGIGDLGPVTTAPDDPAADSLVEYYRLLAGEHPDWEEYRGAMISEQRQLLTIRPAGAVGQIKR